MVLESEPEVFTMRLVFRAEVDTILSIGAGLWGVGLDITDFGLVFAIPPVFD